MYNLDMKKRAQNSRRNVALQAVYSQGEGNVMEGIVIGELVKNSIFLDAVRWLALGAGVMYHNDMNDKNCGQQDSSGCCKGHSMSREDFIEFYGKGQ